MPECNHTVVGVGEHVNTARRLVQWLLDLNRLRVELVIARARTINGDAVQTLETTVDDTSVYGPLPCPPGTRVTDDGRAEGKTAANHFMSEQGKANVGHRPVDHGGTGTLALGQVLRRRWRGAVMTEWEWRRADGKDDR